MDEAQARGIRIDLRALQILLGVPVVGTCASDAEDIRRLRQTIRDVTDGYITRSRRTCRTTLRLRTASAMPGSLRREVVQTAGSGRYTAQHTDRPAPDGEIYRCTAVFLILLAVLFWLTLEGSNVFSVWLQSGFDWLQRVLLRACSRWPQLACGCADQRRLCNGGARHRCHAAACGDLLFPVFRPGGRRISAARRLPDRPQISPAAAPQAARP